MPSATLLEAIAVAAELTQTTLSKPAARIMAEDLSVYPEPMVLAALTRCRRELKGRLAIADVLSRLDDGRPGAEEAWAMLPRDEATTGVWTTEMAEAWGIALPLLEIGEEVPARMAFKEHYQAAVQRARDEKRPPVWQMSIGTSREGRAAPLIEAVRAGRIPADRALPHIPHDEQPKDLLEMERVRLLEAPKFVPMPTETKRLLEQYIAHVEPKGEVA